MNYVNYTNYPYQPNAYSSMPAVGVADLQQQIAALQSQIQNVGVGTYHIPNTIQQYPINSGVLQPPPASIKRYRQIDSVDGIKGAKEYQDSLAPGSSAIIADRNDNVLYMVSVDANGNSPDEIVVVDYQIRKQNASETKSEEVYVLKKDFEAFADEVKKALIKESDNEQPA